MGAESTRIKINRFSRNLIFKSFARDFFAKYQGGSPASKMSVNLPVNVLLHKTFSGNYIMVPQGSRRGSANSAFFGVLG